MAALRIGELKQQKGNFHRAYTLALLAVIELIRLTSDDAITLHGSWLKLSYCHWNAVQLHVLECHVLNESREWERRPLGGVLPGF